MKIQVFLNFVLTIVTSTMFFIIASRIYELCYPDCGLVATLVVGTIGAALSELIIQRIDCLDNPKPPANSSDILDDEAPQNESDYN